MHVIILAGGIGARLWPLSRNDFPKQFIHLSGEHTFLKQTALRAMKMPGILTVVVSTSIDLELLVRRELEGLPIHILVEPCSRSTAPAIALSIRYLELVHKIDSSQPILILPSDHFIQEDAELEGYLKTGLDAAQKGFIVAFGIRPTKPETGYGYIRIGENFGPSCYVAEAFVEKPDLKRAKDYLANPAYFWNSGMFALTSDVFWTEASIHYPEINAMRKSSNFDFHALKSTSFDYAIMEKSDRVLLCPLPIAWSDIGSWENIYEMLDKDEHRNVKIGSVVSIDTKNCLIWGGKRIISTLGLEDLVIVDTEDALLIVRKDESQRVKELASRCASLL
jgi:mannose-1-phosphate guanylyltransferase/mannose-6-phosphate isomerase